MTRVRAMLELAERCEQAAGPDREIDAAIAAALHVKQLTHQSPEWIKDPEFTASLDAAMTLVSEGWRKSMIDADNGRCICEVWHDELPHEDIGVQAATWPLALCVAALRARAADTPKVTP